MIECPRPETIQRALRLAGLINRVLGFRPDGIAVHVMLSANLEQIHTCFKEIWERSLGDAEQEEIIVKYIEFRLKEKS